MALIEKEQATLGQEVQVEIRKKVFTGKIVSKNFIKEKIKLKNFKEENKMKTPTDLLYSKEHEWVSGRRKPM